MRWGWEQEQAELNANSWDLFWSGCDLFRTGGQLRRVVKGRSICKKLTPIKLLLLAWLQLSAPQLLRTHHKAACLKVCVTRHSTVQHYERSRGHMHLCMKWDPNHLTKKCVWKFGRQRAMRIYNDQSVPSQKSEILNLLKSEPSTIKSSKVIL